MTSASDTARRGRGRPPTGAREALVAAARELFVERDFDEVTTDEILERAGVSRGAMYHHFPTKLALFLAAYEASERDLMQRLAAAAEAGPGPFDQLAAGCRAYLRECARSRELQRIGLRQSRQVLGWEGWREAASNLGLGVMRAGVEAATVAGELDSRDVDATTHLLLAALIEAGLLVATAGDPEAVRPGVEAEFLRLLEGMRSA